MNKTQVIGIGIGIFIIGVTTYFLTANNIIHALSGSLSTIGIAFALKWIPLKKSD